MNPGAKALIGLGLIFILLGIGWQLGARSIPLGRLPGDIAIERENFKFYFPVTTCILLSLILQLSVKFLQKFQR